MQLRNKDIRELNKEIEERYSLDLFFEKKDIVNKKEIEDKILIIQDKCLFFYYKKRLIPSLHLIIAKPEILPKITIDMPAIPFIIKGADVMRPGIIKFDEREFTKGDFVVIVDENNKKPLAVGEALFSSEEIKDMEKGKVIQTIHRVGDEIWNTK